MPTSQNNQESNDLFTVYEKIQLYLYKYIKNEKYKNVNNKFKISFEAITINAIAIDEWMDGRTDRHIINVMNYCHFRVVKNPANNNDAD